MDAGSGAMATVLSVPKAAPVELRNPLPESPGMPGVSVYRVWFQPLPGVWISLPCLGLSWVMPPRSEELPYE